mmetsp:Transcript_105474/g.264110  ORF Transcript_105474/g.264110 Transcript_105474/m.264110 type:complete len:228 (-) Transcript_105474:1638-2321(-)
MRRRPSWAPAQRRPSLVRNSVPSFSFQGEIRGQTLASHMSCLLAPAAATLSPSTSGLVHAKGSNRSSAVHCEPWQLSTFGLVPGVAVPHAALDGQRGGQSTCCRTRCQRSSCPMHSPRSKLGQCDGLIHSPWKSDHQCIGGSVESRVRPMQTACRFPHQYLRRRGARPRPRSAVSTVDHNHHLLDSPLPMLTCSQHSAGAWCPPQLREEISLALKATRTQRYRCSLR